MSFDEAVGLLKILSRSGIEVVDIMGGEPLLLDWMPDFVRAALERGIAINLSTNGSRPEMIGRLRGFAGDNVSVGISLEGSTAERHDRMTGSKHFSAVMESLDVISSSGLMPVVKTVVNRETRDDIQAIAELVKEKRLRRYYLIHMDLMSARPSVWSSALGYPAFLSFYKRIRDANPDLSILKVNASCFEKDTLPAGTRCAGGIKKLAVMPDGSVYPCNLFHRLQAFRLGNIFEADIAALLENPALACFGYCASCACTVTDCRNKASCTGGCPAHGYFHKGDPSGADVRCTLY